MPRERNPSTLRTPRAAPPAPHAHSCARVVPRACAADIANLAAALTTAATPVQLIQSIDDFAKAKRLPCVINNPVHIKFLQSNYPSVALQARLAFRLPLHFNFPGHIPSWFGGVPAVPTDRTSRTGRTGRNRTTAYFVVSSGNGWLHLPHCIRW